MLVSYAHTVLSYGLGKSVSLRHTDVNSNQITCAVWKNAMQLVSYPFEISCRNPYCVM